MTCVFQGVEVANPSALGDTASLKALRCCFIQKRLVILMKNCAFATHLHNLLSRRPLEDHSHKAAPSEEQNVQNSQSRFLWLVSFRLH